MLSGQTSTTAILLALWKWYLKCTPRVKSRGVLSNSECHLPESPIGRPELLVQRAQQS